jgi:hypothetical protein
MISLFFCFHHAIGTELGNLRGHHRVEEPLCCDSWRCPE